MAPQTSGALIGHSLAGLPDGLACEYRETCNDLIERLRFIKRDFKRICWVGRHPNELREPLQRLYPGSSDQTIDQGPDLIIDWHNLHHLEAPDAHLHSMRRALAPDGLYIGGCWGGETLSSLQKLFIAVDLEVFEKAYQRLLPLIRPSSMAQLLQRAGFQLPVCDWDRTEVQYSDVRDLLRDIYQLERAHLLGPAIDRRYLRELEQHFQKLESKIFSFDWVWFHGWSN